VTTAWTREHLDALDPDAPALPALSATEVQPLLDELYLWDSWPIRNSDGSVPRFGGEELWMALSAPRAVEPIERHALARIRLLSTTGTTWTDHGDVFPEGATPGSREWAGSAVLDEGRVHVRYTAAGVRDEPTPTFVQRLYEASADLNGRTLTNWSEHREMIEQASGPYRSTLDQTSGEPGFIKAFRDPDVFVDPATDREILLFAASLAESRSGFDGAIGSATRSAQTDPWSMAEPLAHAEGVNNEMERPHIVHHDGSYYLFFSTQNRTFHPDVGCPTGLYGFVANRLDGEWVPLNGSGLVARNPSTEPYQCYSWLVIDDLRVAAFVDMPRLAGRDPDDVEQAGEMNDYFVGTPAPMVRLHLDGTAARLSG